MTSTNTNIQQTMPDELQPNVVVSLCGRDVVVNVGDDTACLYTEAKLWLLGLGLFSPDALKLNPSEVLYMAANILSKTTIPAVFWKYRFEKMLATGLADSALLADLTKLSTNLISNLTLTQAVERQRYVTALLTIEQRGIPVDGDLLQRLRNEKGNITSALGAQLDVMCPFSRQGKIDNNLLSQLIMRENLSWPRTVYGQPRIDIDTLKEMAFAVPCLQAFIPIYKLINTLKREAVRRQLSWPVRVNYDGRLGFLIFPTSSLF